MKRGSKLGYNVEICDLYKDVQNVLNSEDCSGQGIPKKVLQQTIYCKKWIEKPRKLERWSERGGHHATWHKLGKPKTEDIGGNA
jgi:hypothetical protein